MSDKADFLVPGGGLNSPVLLRVVRDLGGDEPTDPELLREEEDRSRIGETIGPYKLLRILGSGGMGAVYLAEHSDPSVSRLVALKALRMTAAGPMIRERFWRERQILAQLQHPSIAQLHDAGETESGTLYYTMEYIDGLPITTYCRERVSTIAGRVRLLLQVAHALARAHRSLIIHRDIKPSNVLVTADGHVKLLDFGIAKSVAESPDSGLTQTRAGPMTPQYAAPEQFHGEPLTVGTDVYQLGMLVFRVLTGCLPFKVDPHDPIEWGKAVTDTEPMSLVQALKSKLNASADGGKATWTDGQTLTRAAREVRGDLDAIVGKALAKAAQDRYETIDAFIRDLEAYLDGDPVSARRAGTLYIAWRRMARRPYLTSLSALAIIALVATASIALQQAAVARREVERANFEARRAESQARDALRTKNFLVDLIGRVDPFHEQKGSAYSAVQLLDYANEEINRRLADAPDAQAELGVAIAGSLKKLGATQEARKAIDSAVTRYRTLRNGNSDGLADALHWHASIHMESGDLKGAERSIRESIALVSSLHGAKSDQALDAKSMLATVLSRSHDYAGALQQHGEVLAELIARLGPVHADVAVLKYRVASSYLLLERLEEAEGTARDALTMLIGLLGEEHQLAIVARSVLASVLLKRGSYSDVERELDWIRIRQGKALTPTHPLIGWVANMRAELAIETRNFVAAGQALADARAILAPINSHWMSTVEYLSGKLALARGEYARAQAHFGNALSVSEAGLDRIDKQVELLRAGSAYADGMLGKLQEASVEIERAITALQTIEEGAREALAQAYAWLAEVRRAQGYRQEAQQAAALSLRYYREFGGEAHPWTRKAAALLAEIETPPSAQ